MLQFHTEMISAKLLWENVFLRGELQNDARKKQNKTNKQTNKIHNKLESALYMKSLSIPISISFLQRVSKRMVHVKMRHFDQ